MAQLSRSGDQFHIHILRPGHSFKASFLRDKFNRGLQSYSFTKVAIPGTKCRKFKTGISERILDICGTYFLYSSCQDRPGLFWAQMRRILVFCPLTLLILPVCVFVSKILHP